MSTRKFPVVIVALFTVVALVGCEATLDRKGTAAKPAEDSQQDDRSDHPENRQRDHEGEQDGKHEGDPNGNHKEDRDGTRDDGGEAVGAVTEQACQNKRLGQDCTVTRDGDALYTGECLQLDHRRCGDSSKRSGLFCSPTNPNEEGDSSGENRDGDGTEDKCEGDNCDGSDGNVAGSDGERRRACADLKRGAECRLRNENGERTVAGVCVRVEGKQTLTCERVEDRNGSNDGSDSSDGSQQTDYERMLDLCANRYADQQKCRHQLTSECDNKQPGQSCKLQTASGSQALEGTCRHSESDRLADDELFCNVSDDPNSGGDGDGDDSENRECSSEDGKNDPEDGCDEEKRKPVEYCQGQGGKSCTVELSDGRRATGTCRLEDGKAVCDIDEVSDDTPQCQPNPIVEACVGKRTGASCVVEHAGAKLFEGRCFDSLCVY